MMKYLSILFFLCYSSVMSQDVAVSEVRGVLIEKETDIPIFSAVAMIEVDSVKYQAKTDFDGQFLIRQIPCGKHELKFRQFGDTLSITIEVLKPNTIVDLGRVELSFPKIIFYCPTFSPSQRFNVSDPLKPTVILEEDIRYSTFVTLVAFVLS